MRTLKARVTGYKQEIGTPLSDGLTGKWLIIQLGREAERRKEILMLSKRRNQNAIEIELKESLRRREEDIQAKLERFGNPAVDGTTTVDDLESRTRKLWALNTFMEALTRRVKDVEETESTTTEIRELRVQLEEIQNQQVEDGRNMSKQQKTTEQYLAKRQMLFSRKEECSRNIRDLGVLPEEALRTRENYTLSTRAFEQYNNFAEQRDQLLKRREELDKSAASIEDLVQILDQRKDETIERTFKQVAKNCEERRIDQDEEVDDEQNEETQQSTIDNYMGVSIKVSFNSKVDEHSAALGWAEVAGGFGDRCDYNFS
ncbi:hypothetical protein D9756_011020 [Leucocoprinus leucothites]|uniref:Uncharacterized protein n=1 Tax=Leucocoprinus leucothites TaxID=201217 RepID=A0A8H5CSE3_9AGAR|nr:hypothetical protein D9756_011020 [Leucoagaricus leucothites]